MTKLSGIIIATALGVSTANAAIFSQAATVSGSGAPDYTLAYLEFAGFDSSLGTLNGITIQGQITVQETLTYLFASSTSPLVPVTVKFDLSAGNQPYVYTTQTSIGSATYPANGSEVVTVSNSSALTNVLSSAFVHSTAATSGFGGEIGGAVTSPAYPSIIYGTVTATATAFYDYTPTSVPEPSSLALMAVLGVLPVLRRRVKA